MNTEKGKYTWPEDLNEGRRLVMIGELDPGNEQRSYGEEKILEAKR